MIFQLAVPGPIADVDELRVLQWHGAAGDAFARGDLIVELETHKAVVEVRAGQPGILRLVLCAAGGWERVGQPLALLSDTPDEPLPELPAEARAWPVDFEIT